MGGQPGLVFPVDTEQHSLMEPIPTEIDPRSMAISPSGGVVYVSNLGSDSITVIDTTTNGVATVIDLESSPLQVAFAPPHGLPIETRVLVSGVLPDGRYVLTIRDTTDRELPVTVPIDEAVTDIALVEVPGGCAAAVPIPTATATPTLAASGRCVGDCDADEAVSVAELVAGIGIALGDHPFDSCQAFDCNETGVVSIDCLTAAVLASLHGCP